MKLDEAIAAVDALLPRFGLERIRPGQHLVIAASKPESTG